MKTLKDYIIEGTEIHFDPSVTEPDRPQNETDAPEENEDEEDADNGQPIKGGIDILLAGEIRYYSEADHIFKERKQAISDYYKNEIKYDMVWTADYIEKTPIFQKYLEDLIHFYKENVDENAKLNVSTHDELARQLADDIILLSKNTQIR